ncbi:glycosyltransferase [Formosa sp. S-31]|uniref:glycosyltransferase n=1 Tax=Formosa sp. S-31 TaxID=2790949 RepID=UPI003EBAD8EE
MFSHFLITRFNLRKEDWKTNKNRVEVLTDEWHRNRFKLFTNFCVPSVASQTNTNFTWLVFFDKSTTPEFKVLISEIESQLPNFKPLFIDGMSAFLPEIKKQVQNCKSDYIITSRLDNDDCISKHYINSIQAKFKHQDFMALDYINGYTMQTSTDMRIGKRLHQFNPFLSLIEKNNSPKTIWSMNHADWKREASILQIKDEPMWCSVIHSENKVNEFVGYGLVNINQFLKNLSCPEQ